MTTTANRKQGGIEFMTVQELMAQVDVNRVVETFLKWK